MSISDLDQLEEKINRIVSQMKALLGENLALKKRIELLEKEAASMDSESSEIRSKIEAMIRVIDSIET